MAGPGGGQQGVAGTGPTGLQGQWQLSIRVDRPVEGCEIAPHVHLYHKGGDKMVNATPRRFTYSYRWLRGPTRPVCANELCPRAQSFSPMQWSKFSRKGVSFSVQCVACARLRAPRHQSVFCTLQCFRDAWKAHKCSHSSLASQRLAHSKSLSSQNSGASEDDSEDVEATPPPPPADWIMTDTSDLEWQEVSNERCYVPQEEDVGRCLKLEVRVLHSSNGAPLFHTPRVADTEPVLSSPPLPPKRMMATVKQALAPGGVKLRVATYNVLAEIYASQQMYPYCDPWALAWNYRKANLLREIRETQADVLFLQEVQADHYEQDILPELNEQGYEGLYKNKTREAMGAQGKVDGCAVFWRRTKFRLVEKWVVEFNDCARRQASDMGLSHDQQQAFLQRLLKDNIAQAVVVEVLGRTGAQQTRRGGSTGGQLLCLANTHLYSHPEFPDVKLWQCYQLLHWLQSIVLAQHATALPLILCGDFNSEPASAVYELVAQRQVALDHADLPSEQASEAVLRSLYLLADHGPPPHSISHSLQLKSAYYMVQGEEPRFTNYTVGYEGTLDYIFFSPHTLRPAAVAIVPEEAVLQSAGEALPSVQQSSDHLMLVADLQLLPAPNSPMAPPLGMGNAQQGLARGDRKTGTLGAGGGFLAQGGGRA